MPVCCYTVAKHVICVIRVGCLQCDVCQCIYLSASTCTWVKTIMHVDVRTVDRRTPRSSSCVKHVYFQRQCGRSLKPEQCRCCNNNGAQNTANESGPEYYQSSPSSSSSSRARHWSTGTGVMSAATTTCASLVTDTRDPLWYSLTKPISAKMTCSQGAIDYFSERVILTLYVQYITIG